MAASETAFVTKNPKTRKRVKKMGFDSENDNKSTDDESTTRRRRSSKNAKAESSSESDKEATGFLQQLPDKPIHGNEESLFSSGSDFYNFRGVLNNCIILLVLSNAKQVLENFLKHGILVDSVNAMEHFLRDPYTWPSMCLILVSPLFAVVAMCCEKLLNKDVITAKSLVILHVVNLIVILAFPVAVTLCGEPSPVGAALALSTYTVLWLKMVSYMQVNYWCRTAADKTKKLLEENEELKKSGRVWYPNNLYLTDILYFIWAPTLCYELNFPRTKKIRWIFLLRRFIEFVFILYALNFFGQQWIIPIVRSSVKPLKEMDYGGMVQQLLTLAVPNHLLWLLFFYWFFHSVLNMMAEILRFADREFYKDWWNARTVSKFWQHWNIPAHRWASRHVYKPLRNAGYNRLVAAVVVFGISAFFHEFLVSIPLHMVRLWAFTAMVMQVPLACLTAIKLMQGQIGNCIVWLSIVLGQPIAILMYLHDYYIIHIDTPGRNGTDV